MASPPCLVRADRAARLRRSDAPSADNCRSVEIFSVKPNAVRLLSKAVQRLCVSASRGGGPVLAPDIFGCKCPSRRNIARDHRERLHRAFGLRHSTINRDGYSSSSSSKSRKFFCWRRSRCGLRAAAAAARPSSSSDNRPGVFFRRSFADRFSIRPRNSSGREFSFGMTALEDHYLSQHIKPDSKHSV